jgi:uncharacterized iron-regulated membrane protein
MGNRSYNILLHTHTVSGILISVALYVIFFAGSFSFFRDEIVNWERAHAVNPADELTADINNIVRHLEKDYQLNGRDVELRHYYNERLIGVTLGASRNPDTAAEDKAGDFFYLDPESWERASYPESYTLGEFLYRLHFFAQIPYPYGYYLSGFVAFFFLFAIITGIAVHWKKIIPNFFQFRPKAKLKTLWTDAHTALGVIGFPFQFVYAVTGAFFMLNILLVAPGVAVIFDGNDEEFYSALEYDHPSFDFEGQPLEMHADINTLIADTRDRWEGFKINEVHIFNYGDTSMHVGVSGHLPYADKFNAVGEAIYCIAENAPVEIKDPLVQNTYLDGVKNVLYRLHLGDYGGYPLRITSFFLGFIGCFVILSGVLLWFTARNKKNISLKKRRFNERVMQWYLAICLSMYPVTSAAFILVKCINPLGMERLYWFYFISWGLLSAWFIIKRDAYLTNRYSLFSGSILGLLVPFSNGLTTGLWPWKTFNGDTFQIFFIDMFWLALAILGLIVVKKLKKNRANAEPMIRPGGIPLRQKDVQHEVIYE